MCTDALKKPPKSLPSDETVGGPYTLRVPTDERVDWDKAAANYGAKIGKPVSLSAWVRVVCNEAAGV
ncbi:Hypothetical protein I5071_9370 [Sandaracinus amylolyticus]|nr:Hypothetical protein I5071_9370 [Sandaracinus amylolyticus]